MDDGCQTLEESVSCVRSLVEHGFIGTVCTPHMGMGTFPLNIPADVFGRVASLQERLLAAGIGYRLWSGGELRIGGHTLSWLRENGVPTLGASRVVLVDYWGSSWSDYADGVVNYLLEQEYQLVLAHPERMNFKDDVWDAVLRQLEGRGIWLQGNLRCLAGGEGPRIQERALRLLRDGRYRILTTDMHGPEDLPDRLIGLSVVEKVVGQRGLCELLGQNVQEIVGDAEETNSRA